MSDEEPCDVCGNYHSPCAMAQIRALKQMVDAVPAGPVEPDAIRDAAIDGMEEFVLPLIERQIPTGYRIEGTRGPLGAWTDGPRLVEEER